MINNDDNLAPSEGDKIYLFFDQEMSAITSDITTAYQEEWIGAGGNVSFVNEDFTPAPILTKEEAGVNVTDAPEGDYSRGKILEITLGEAVNNYRFWGTFPQINLSSHSLIKGSQDGLFGRTPSFFVPNCQRENEENTWFQLGTGEVENLTSKYLKRLRLQEISVTLKFTP